MQSSQSMYNLSSVSSSQYVPSHLGQIHRTPQLPKSSPPHMRRSSTVSRFGGPSFGTPKPSRSSRPHETSLEDAPPVESIYDYNGGAPFSPAQNDVSNPALFVSTSPRKEAVTLASPPSAVTVFGFPPELTSKVLEHFSRFGRVEEHSSSDAQNVGAGNNWMKITYENSIAAQQAVAANGTFVGGQYMVGCVFAQTDPLFSVAQDQDDKMDIDPQTPPRQRMATPDQHRPNFSNGPFQTPARGQVRSNMMATGTPAGRKIEILNSEAIYKSNSPMTERAAGWMPGWLSSTEEAKIPGTPVPSGQAVQAQEQAPGWTSRMLRGLVDTIFGF